MKKNIFFLLFLLISLSYADIFKTVNENFNQNLSENQKNQLIENQVLIRNVKKAQNLSLCPVNSDCERLIDTIKELNPNYLAEIIKISDVKPDDKVINKMFEALCDIPSYKGIPYWSVENKKWFELYSQAGIISKTVNQNQSVTSASITAFLHMNPFETMDVQIEVTKHKDSLYYQNFNSGKILWNKIAIIKPKAMRSVIVVYKSGDKWIMYGCCGAIAPKFPGLTRRIEVSFLNRIKTFVNFIFEKI